MPGVHQEVIKILSKHAVKSGISAYVFHDSSVDQVLKGLAKNLNKSNLGYKCLKKTTQAIFWYPFPNIVFKTTQGVCFFNILCY